MRKAIFAFFLLASVGCSTARRAPEPIDNCVLSLEGGEVFSCVDASGKPYTLLLMNARDLVCFKRDQFKTLMETLHQ